MRITSKLSLKNIIFKSLLHQVMKGSKENYKSERLQKFILKWQRKGFMIMALPIVKYQSLTIHSYKYPGVLPFHYVLKVH